MARMGFRTAIYQTIGYTRTRDVDDRWKPFHDRVSLAFDKVPDGYFSVFKESADLSVTLGEQGIYPNEGLVPDISIGLVWGRFWNDNNLALKFGPRREYQHSYPDYFPQSASNPQAAWCYPESSLGDFKKWLREQYIRGGKFENYIGSQVQKKQIAPETARKALVAYSIQPRITGAR